MSEFEDKVEEVKGRAILKLRQWKEEDAAKKVMRNYLNEEGLRYKDKSKLEELLDERHNLALSAEDENVKLKAIDSSIALAAGSEKIVATQNNQFNFGEFLNKINE